MTAFYSLCVSLFPVYLRISKALTYELHSTFIVMQVVFQLERRYSLLVLTIFVPTFLLLLIGYTTLYIKLAAFQVQLLVLYYLDPWYKYCLESTKELSLQNVEISYRILQN